MISSPAAFALARQFKKNEATYQRDGLAFGAVIVFVLGPGVSLEEGGFVLFPVSPMLLLLGCAQPSITAMPAAVKAAMKNFDAVISARSSKRARLHGARYER